MANFEDSSLIEVSSSEHGKAVIFALRNLFDSKRGADFDFNWDGRSVRAHRMVLELFLAPELIGLNKNTGNAKQEVMDCNDASNNNVLECLLEFMYKGEVSVPEKQLDDLLRIAKELDFQILVDAVVQSCSSKNGRVSLFKIERTLSTNSVRNDELASPGISIEETGDCSEDSNSLLCGSNNFKIVRNSDLELGMPLSESHAGGSLDRIVKEEDEVTLSPYSETSSPQDLSAFEPNIQQSSTSDKFCLEAKRIKVEIVDLESEVDDRLVEDGVIGSVNLLQPQYSSNEDSCCDSSHAEMLDEPNNVPLGSSSETNPKDIGSQKIYKCPHCDDYETPKYMQHYYHVLYVHGLTVRGEPAPMHKCPDCDYSTIVASNLKSHRLSVHSGNKPFVCTICNFRSSQSRPLKRHLIDVHGEGVSRYTCETCRKMFSSIDRLRRHIGIHIKEQCHKCMHCSYAAKHETTLNKHVRAHHEDCIQERPGREPHPRVDGHTDTVTPVIGFLSPRVVRRGLDFFSAPDPSDKGVHTRWSKRVCETRKKL